MMAVKGDSKGRAMPALICDGCREEITDWKMANVEYEPFPEEDQVFSILVVHKGCSHRPTRKRFWMGLEEWLSWLITNNKWGKEKKGHVTVEIKEPLEF